MEIRRLVRLAVAKRLQDTMSTYFGDRVWTNFREKLDVEHDLPCALVTFRQDTVEEYHTDSTLEMRRTLELVVHIIVRQTDQADDALDHLSDLVDRVLHGLKFEPDEYFETRLRAQPNASAETYLPGEYPDTVAMKQGYQVRYLKDHSVADESVDLQEIWIEYNVEGNELEHERATDLHNLSEG